MKMEIKKEVQELLKKEDDLKTKIIEELDKMPDNPKINKISDSPIMFTINIKDLDEGLILSPSYYSSKYQAKIIADLVRKKNITSVMKMLEEIIEKGTYKIDSYNYMKFNEHVREYLKNLL